MKDWTAFDTRLNTAGPWQWGALVDAGARALLDAGISAPRRTARWLVEGIRGVNAASLIAWEEQEAGMDDVQLFEEAIGRCRRHEPLQYVLGTVDFCGIRLRVTPDVLIPRPETELVVQAALRCIKAYPGARVLDVGTGSGCIALAMKEARSDLHVVACDISQAALRVAEENARSLDLAVSFVQADILSPVSGFSVTRPFNLIVSNPPYVPEDEYSALPYNVRGFEPAVALTCGKDPLRFYRAISRLQPFVTPGGSLVLEVHADYGPRVQRHLVESGYGGVTLHHDLAGLPRIVTATKHFTAAHAYQNSTDSATRVPSSRGQSSPRTGQAGESG